MYTHSDHNRITAALFANCGRVRTASLPHEEAPGYKIIDSSTFCGVVNAIRDFAQVLIDTRCHFPAGALDHVYAVAKANGSYENLIGTLAYLATWGSAQRVNIGTSPKETEYFDFNILDPLGVVILVGGVKYYPDAEPAKGRWLVHT